MVDENSENHRDAPKRITPIFLASPTSTTFENTSKTGCPNEAYTLFVEKLSSLFHEDIPKHIVKPNICKH